MKPEEKVGVSEAQAKDPEDISRDQSNQEQKRENQKKISSMRHVAP